jgi:integrase
MKKLKKYKKTNERTPFLDFKPSELKKHSDENWIIVFYWKPTNGTEKMTRFRRRVKFMSNKRERTKYANIKMAHINDLLQSGWNPVNSKTEFIGSFLEVLDIYIESCKKRYQNDKLRFDTFRTNSSFVRSIKLYIQIRQLTSMECNEFTKKFVLSYIEHKEFNDEVSQRTINNHLSFLSTLNKYMIDQEYIDTNVVSNIAPRKLNKKKIRQRIPEQTKILIFDYLKINYLPFYTLSLMTYLCFIRRTEISKMKVKHIDLSISLITVPESISKSKKDGYVTIPDQYSVILGNHIKYAAPNDYVFSNENFEPGKVQMKPRRISDFWYILRKKLDLPKEYQFYSLKDTGITENFERGIPAILIRNQARHENVSTTELYAPKKETADDTIRKIYYKL